MAVRPTYNKTKGSLVSMGASEQGLDYKLKGYSSYVDSLNTKLASMQKYSQKKAEDEATEEGINEALETNRDTDTFLASSDKIKKEIVGEDKWFKSKKEVAYTNTMYALLTNDIMTKAQTDINNLGIQATLQGMTSKNYYKNLITIKNNYSTAFNDIDAAVAFKLNEEFMSTIPKLYAAYATKESAKYKQGMLNNVNALGTEVIRQVEGFIIGHLANSPPETLFDALDRNKQMQIDRMGKVGASSTTFETAYHKEIIKALALEFAEGTENNPIRGLKILKQFSNGKFDDPKLQAVYKQLSATEKTEIQKALFASLSDNITTKENEEKTISLGKVNEVKDIRFRYYIARAEQDYKLAKEIVEEARELDPDLYVELSKQLDDDDDGGEFTVETNDEGLGFVDLQDKLIITRDLKHEDIQESYNFKFITHQQKTKLDADLENSKLAKFTEAEGLMRRAFGWAEHNIIDKTGKDREAFNLYNQKVNELFMFMRKNPDATAEEITAKAETLTGDIDVQKQKDNKIEVTQRKIKDDKGTFRFSHSLWKPYLHNFYIPATGGKYKHENFKTEFLDSTEGVQRLILELEELRELEHGSLLEDKFDFGTGFRDKIFKRPIINGKPITNDFINLFIEQLEILKNELGEVGK